MNILALIPARMGSSRFPGKPMAKILGKPMIEHVYENVKKCELLTKTVIATCDKEIADHIQSINGNAVMTSNRHERASDRCAEALLYIEEKDKIKYDIIVMVQGDEPMTHADMITEAITPMLENSNIIVTNLMGDIKSEEEFDDRNCIKVVCDLNNNALCFSREPIPTRKFGNVSMRKQVCVIPFTRKFLLEYTKLSPTPIEIFESVDMMRVLEHGKKVKMVHTKFLTYPVDTEKDLLRVEKLMRLIDQR
ncbi:MAG: 3-deoxy-manno-octulosonate cytidylyltransferase [Euryarchaeota archaeon TMED85]|nr:MAG: 3-deoxy-manno-octulosonate cytidylyltransferase [Euryarchaeota archaeon TMED85]|tara:strand:+ start:15859 stop:16608 length:750 start_codon:yes stop_codon:yes gene_type:complete